MEKNIHTHLFTSLVTSRENRLTFLAAGPEFKQPESEAEHNQQEQELRDKLAKDPTMKDEEIQGRLNALQTSKFLAGTNLADLGDLQTKATEFKDKRAKEKQDLTNAEDASKPEKNATLKSIDDAFKSTDDEAKSDAAFAANNQASTSTERIKEFVDPSRPPNAVAQTEAHLAVLNALQTIDKDGKIFEDRKGDVAASARSVNALSTQVSTDETTDFAKSLKSLDAAKGKVGAVLDTAVTDARKAAADFKDNVWGEIYNIANANLPLKETQDLIRQMLSSIKEINKKLNEKIADVTGKAPDAKAPDKPADEKADKPKEFTDKERAAIGEAQEGFRLAVKALRDGKSIDEADAILAEKTNIALDKVGDRKAAIKEIIGSGKEFDESAGKPSFHVKFVEKNQDIHIEDMTKKSEKAADKPADSVTEKEKNILEKILEFLEKIFKQMREADASKTESSIDTITAKLKALDEEKKGLTEKLGKTTDKKERDSIQLQIDNITLKENELNRQLADVRSTNKKLSADLDKSAEGSAITVRQDKNGNIVLSARDGFNNQQFQNQVQYMQGANPYAKRYIQPYTNRSYTITNYYAGRDLFVNSNGNNSNNTVNSNNNNGSNRGNFTDNRRFDNRSFDNRVDNRQSFDNRVDARQDNRRFDNRVTNNNTTTRETGSDAQRGGGGNRAPLASSDEPGPDVLESNRRFRDRNLDTPAPGRERADVAPPPSVSGTGGGRPIRGPVAGPSTAPRRNEAPRTNKKAPTPQKAKGTDTVRGNVSRAD